TYTATLGGPIVKDRLWFFLAGRKASTSTQATFDQTGIAHTDTNDNKREEVKLTGTIAPNHTLQGSYINNSTTSTAPAFDFSIDPATILSDQKQPNHLFVVSYTGVVSSKMFLEAQYSEKKFRFENSGGADTSIASGSPILSLGSSGEPAFLHYHAPYFDATDPEDRNNRQLTASLSYYLSTPHFGKHDLKGGVESFRTTHTGGNSQSPTSYVFF